MSERALNRREVLLLLGLSITSTACGESYNGAESFSSNSFSDNLLKTGRLTVPEVRSTLKTNNVDINGRYYLESLEDDYKVLVPYRLSFFYGLSNPSTGSLFIEIPSNILSKNTRSLFSFTLGNNKLEVDSLFDNTGRDSLKIRYLMGIANHTPKIDYRKTIPETYLDLSKNYTASISWNNWKFKSFQFK